MPSTHQQHEDRSLRMHRIIANKFEKDPEQVTHHALTNLQRWRNQGVECDDFDLWEDFLKHDHARLHEALTGTNPDSVRLRQSSPFAGLISEQIRHQILVETR